MIISDYYWSSTSYSFPNRNCSNSISTAIDGWVIGMNTGDMGTLTPCWPLFYDRKVLPVRAGFFGPSGPSDHFEFSNIPSSQSIGIPFSITITARDANGNIVTGFNGSVSLSATIGNVTSPTINLVSGTGSGNISLNTIGNSIQITASASGKQGQSNYFNVVDASNFSEQNNVGLNTVIISNPIICPSLNPQSISIVGGEYSINGGAFTSALGTISNGQTVRVRLTSPGTGETTAQATLYIGGTSYVFRVTTFSGKIYLPIILKDHFEITQLTCWSVEFQPNQCSSPTIIHNASVAVEVSDAECIKDESWGFTSNYIWVNDGCRATFNIN